MPESIGHQVRDGLLQAVRVPVAEQVAGRVEVDSTSGERAGQLFDDRPAELPDVHRLRMTGNAVARSEAREVEELFDEPAHSLTGRQDALDVRRQPFVDGAPLDHPRG